MAIKDTYLELAPEHGGLRFGPFKGMEIRLGSLPSPHNDITLPEDLGILSEHVKVIDQKDGSFVIAPIERSAGVFIWRSGSAPKQIVTPIAIMAADDIHSADAFSLGSVEGPKFYLLRIEREKPKEQSNDAFGKARKRLTGKSMLDEIKRQGMASVITTKGGAFFQYYWTFIRTGTIFRPRYILMFFLLFAGWVTSGLVGIFSCSVQASNWSTGKDLEKANKLVKECYGSEKSEERTFSMEFARMLAMDKGRVDGDVANKWRNGFAMDGGLMKEVQEEYKKMMATPNTYARWYRQKGTLNPVGELRRALKKSGLNQPSATAIFAFMAANDTLTLDNDFHIGQDSMAQPACLRGPLRMTWRQAANLKWNDTDFSAVDRVVPSDEFTDTSSSDEKACKALGNTVSSMVDLNTAVFRSESCPGNYSTVPGITNDSDNHCMYTTQPDARSVATTDGQGDLIMATTDWGKLSNALKRSFEGSHLPGYGDMHDVTQRLAWFYMADMNKKGDFEVLKTTFKSILSIQNSPVDAMSGLDEVPPQTPAWAKKRIARVYALSVAVRCLARYESKRLKSSKIGDLAKNMGMTEDEIPPFIDCGILGLLATAEE